MWIKLNRYDSVSFAVHQVQTSFSGWWRIFPLRIPVRKKKLIIRNKAHALEIIKLSLLSYMKGWSVYFSGGFAHRELDRCSGIHLPHLGPCAYPEGRRHFLPLSGEPTWNKDNIQFTVRSTSNLLYCIEMHWHKSFSTLKNWSMRSIKKK